MVPVVFTRRRIMPGSTLRCWGVAVGVVLSATLVGACSSSQGKTLRFETVPVERGTVIGRVTASGTLSALVTVQVGSQVSGRIQKLFVDFNSPVKKGQVIATIDPSMFKAAVEQARANLIAAQGNYAKAKAQAEDAKRQFERAKELFERKLIAPAERDTLESAAMAAAAQVEAARGAVEQARAALNQALINLKYCTIVSPIDGIVISRNVDVGQTVAAALQAPTLFTIAEDLRKMQVDTNVAEADVGKLRAGMSAYFTVDAYPGERFMGKVRQIRHAPQTVQNVVTYDAVIDVENPDLRLKPGMTANVTFVYAERHDVLKIGNAALRFRPPPTMLEERRSKNDGGNVPSGEKIAQRPGKRSGEGELLPGAQAAQPREDRRAVWVLRGDRPEKVFVRVGISDGSFTEVVEGDLKEGDRVIVDVIGSEARGRPPGGGPSGFKRIL